MKDETLPNPTLLKGKEFPSTLYTSKNFDTSVGSLVSNLHLTKEEEEEDGNGDIDASCSVGKCSRSNKIPIDSFSTQSNSFQTKEERDGEGEDDHLPAGQHLLVDIKNVNKTFLNSDVQLAKAMVDVVNDSKLTLLSYHCHHLLPQGVSCVGVLLESHISFHTWPEEGIITLDLFTCGSGKLIPVLPIIKRLFAIPETNDDGGILDSNKLPHMNWSHKLRGFRDGKKNHLSEDIDKIIGSMDHSVKTLLSSVQTKYQTVDIYEHGKSTNPDKIVYLDGILQSTLLGNEAYHEALVHPAMFTHTDPQRVAIIGGGEGATLKEVLKHKSVKTVKMVEIDGELVQLSKKHLPEWSSCADYVGSATWCGDDSRAYLYYEDAFAWFNHRFSDELKIDNKEYEEEPFDVLIMDALDPQDDVPFADFLYTNNEYFVTLYNALQSDGILVLQLGEAPRSINPPEDISREHKRAFLTKTLSNIGFKSIHVYDEGHCGFGAPWSFLVAMKSFDSRAQWYRNSAEINLSVQQRIVETYSGLPALQYFDGASMNAYQVPHKTFESVYCRRNPTPWNCIDSKYIDKMKDIPRSSIDVKMSQVGDQSGRGIFAKIDIEENSTIIKQDAKTTVHFPISTYALICYLYEINEKWTNAMTNYVEGYGWSTDSRGDAEWYVDSGILTFCNHGCNDSFNTKSRDLIKTERKQLSFKYEAQIFDPYFDRHLKHGEKPFNQAIQFISAGDEILCDYSTYHTDAEEENIEWLKAICDQTLIGEVTLLDQESN